MSLEHIKEYVKRQIVPRNRTLKFQNLIKSYYRNVDGISAKELPRFILEDYDKHGETLGEMLLEIIFNHNPKLAPYRKNFSATIIVTNKEYTQNSRMGNFSVISLDMLTCGLVHDLNRIFVETLESEKFTPEVKRHVRETLDYYADKLLISRGGTGRALPNPILPAYANTLAAKFTGAIILNQEIFLVAHELGHYFIDQNLLHLFHENTLDKAQGIFHLILSSEKKFKSLNDEQKKSLFDEVFADEIAYQIFHETNKNADALTYTGVFYYLNILLSSQYYVKYLLKQTSPNSYELLSWQVRLKYYYLKFKELGIWGAPLNNHILEYVKVIADESFKLRPLYSNQAKRKKQSLEKNKRKATKKSRKINRKK